MKTAIALGAVLAALVVPLATPAVADAPTIEIKPAQLERGADSTVPRMVGDTTIVHGDVRIELDEPGYLLGQSGAEYVVASFPQILRVSADGTTEEVTRYGKSGDPMLSSDGADVLISRLVRARTMIRVVDATSGELISTGRFSRYAAVLDAYDSRAVLTATSPQRVLSWNYRSGATKRVVRRGAGTADIVADRLATLTGDVYEGGCTVVSQLTRPRNVLWRSCEEIPISFSPNGKRMVTVHLLTDGLGPGTVRLRTARGKLIATYEAYYFGSIDWETNRSLLLDAHTRNRAAIVRCDGADCERASGIRRSSLRG